MQDGLLRDLHTSSSTPEEARSSYESSVSSLPR
jgi:hypothetical protein